MSSYFIKRGAPAERGCMDEEVLRRMVAEEHLAPDDLVWIDGRTPGWVRATAVPGLFPEPKPDPRDEPGPQPLQQSARPAVEAQKPRRKKNPFQRPFGGKLFPVLILALIGAVGAFWLPRFYAGRMSLPRAEAPPQPAAPTNTVAAAGATRDWSPGVDAAQVSQSIAVGLAMGDSNVVAHAVAWVVKAPPEQLKIAPFWPVLGQLSERGQPRVAETLCRALLRAHPRDPRLGLELAALLCSQGRNDDSLDALKEAMKYASEEAKKRSAADPRFTPLRGNRRFTRYFK